MLADTLALGAGGTALTFVKRFGEKEPGTRYTVAGETVDSSHSLNIKYTEDRSKTVRTLIDLSTNVPIPGSTTGAFRTRRVYLNIVRGPSDSAADIKGDLTRLKTIIDSTSLQDQFLDQTA